MKRITTTTARKPTQRAFDDWRTTCAARSGENSMFRACGGDVNRSTGAGSDGSRGTGSRSSVSAPGSPALPGSSGPPGSIGPPDGRSSLIGYPRLRRDAWRSRRSPASDAARRRTRRDEAWLAERDREWPERDLAGVDGQHPGAVDRDREAVHAPRRRPERRAIRLLAETVVARAMARTLEPEVLQAWVRLAAEVRATLVQRPHVEGLTVAGRALAGDEPLLARVAQ